MVVLGVENEGGFGADEYRTARPEMNVSTYDDCIGPSATEAENCRKIALLRLLFPRSEFERDGRIVDDRDGFEKSDELNECRWPPKRDSLAGRVARNNTVSVRSIDQSEFLIRSVLQCDAQSHGFRDACGVNRESKVSEVRRRNTVEELWLVLGLSERYRGQNYKSEERATHVH
jgi:hypothetical protein